MRASYASGNLISLPENHAFPIGKYQALYELLMSEGLIEPVEPGQASWEDLRLVHTDSYLSNLQNGTLSRKAERRLGLPYSPQLLRRARLSVQGTINAALMALEDRIAANLGGGTHHAFPDHGEGFCVFNDVAVAIKVLQRDQVIARVLVIDLDVHQGNGTAAIFAGDEAVYTFSMHGERNYPVHKVPSTCDVDLPTGAGDQEYLRTLSAYLPGLFDESQPDLAFYLAGVDVAQGDRFGRLALTADGIWERDRYVLEAANLYGVPICVLMAGGYSKTPQAIAALHALVHREAKRIYG